MELFFSISGLYLCLSLSSLQDGDKFENNLTKDWNRLSKNVLCTGDGFLGTRGVPQMEWGQRCMLCCCWMRWPLGATMYLQKSPSQRDCTSSHSQSTETRLGCASSFHLRTFMNSKHSSIHTSYLKYVALVLSAPPTRGHLQIFSDGPDRDSSHLGSSCDSCRLLF